MWGVLSDDCYWSSPAESLSGPRPYSQSQNYVTPGGLPPISSSWRQAFFPQLNTCDYCPYAALSLSREDRSVVYNRSSHSQVRVPQGSRPHFTVSDSRLPQPRGPGPCIYIPQEQGSPVIPPGTWFPFRRLL
jgi:hypothetical protein